ncbi:MAG TPA: DUF4258 domain-containing protein [Flavobacterium sp.]|uniref:DUF4258 domain-containing protein n=1 Tax=unclassified Flavobacterium TaxID=196869 RepID=UPI000E9A3A0E|nr:MULTISPECIES: DUF4258 domain-containing protein [unclassified Flavobacterium]HBI00700.1 hypothetical protein [Flavobacterium sp.]HRE78748.1 DUF4258 domain-containing protein [Flavobacterium sp.]
MKFYQRLAFFLFGLLIGVIFLIYFLGAKADARGVTFCYLPNCRVLKDIRTKPFHYSEEASAVLAETWIDTIDIKNTLTHGDVDFDLSNVKEGAAKLYVIEGKTVNQVPITLEVLNFEKKAVLKSIKK